MIDLRGSSARRPARRALAAALPLLLVGGPGVGVGGPGVGAGGRGVGVGGSQSPGPCRAPGGGIGAAGGVAPGSAVTLPAGLRLEYGLSLGPIHAGQATLTVGPRRVVDGVAANRVAMTVKGGALFLRLEDSLSSRVATGPLRTLESDRWLHEGPHRDAYRIDLTGSDGRFRILPPGGAEADDGPDPPGRDHADGPMPAAPLDQLAVLFLPRALALATGSEDTVPRFFECSKNPIVVRVLGRERLRTPAGRFDVVRLGVEIPGTGMFAPERKARVYVTDDTARTVVQLTAHTALGRLKLYLTGREGA